MKILTIATLAMALSQAALAAPLPSRAERMKSCAEQWQLKKAARKADGLKYQTFMSDCMKAPGAAPARR